MDDAAILDMAASVLALVVAVGYVHASHVVGRFWREERGRSGRAGFIVSLLVTPLLGWIIGRVLEPHGSATTVRRSLRDELEQTYRVVDANLHAHP